MMIAKNYPPICVKNVVNSNLELRRGFLVLTLMIFGILGHQVWPPLCYNIKTIKVFYRLTKRFCGESKYLNFA